MEDVFIVLRNYPDEIDEEKFSDEDKHIFTAIVLSEKVVNGKEQNCYIFTSDSEMVKKYKENKHMNGVKRVEILSFNEALEKINSYFEKYRLKVDFERI